MSWVGRTCCTDYKFTMAFPKSKQLCYHIDFPVTSTRLQFHSPVIRGRVGQISHRLPTPNAPFHDRSDYSFPAAGCYHSRLWELIKGRCLLRFTSNPTSLPPASVTMRPFLQNFLRSNTFALSRPFSTGPAVQRYTFEPFGPEETPYWQRLRPWQDVTHEQFLSHEWQVREFNSR